MAGPKADGVYWFQKGFGFTTSTAYATELPPWLTAFNANLLCRLRNEGLVRVPLGPADGTVLPGERKADITVNQSSVGSQELFERKDFAPSLKMDF